MVKPGYIADLIECQCALVRALNTAANALGAAGDSEGARRAIAERDAALAGIGDQGVVYDVMRLDARVASLEARIAKERG